MINFSPGYEPKIPPDPTRFEDGIELEKWEKRLADFTGDIQNQEAFIALVEASPSEAGSYAETLTLIYDSIIHFDTTNKHDHSELRRKIEALTEFTKDMGEYDGDAETFAKRLLEIIS